MKQKIGITAIILLLLTILSVPAWSEVNLPHDMVTILTNELIGKAHTWTASQTFTGGVTAYGPSGGSPFIVSDSGVTVEGITVSLPYTGIENFTTLNGLKPFKYYDQQGILRAYMTGTGQQIWQVASGTTEIGKILYSTGTNGMIYFYGYDMATNSYPTNRKYRFSNDGTNFQIRSDNAGDSSLTIGRDGGIGIGNVSVFSPFTKHLEFNTGTSGVPVGPGFVAYADTSSGATKIHAYDLTGTFAALSSFNENGKAERTEVNIFAGIKAVWNDDGTVTYSQVPKVNPETEHRKIWIANWKQNNQINEQVSEVEAWEIVTVSEDATAKIGEEDRFIPDPETRSVKKVKVDKMVPVKIWYNETRLKDGVLVDSDSGKFYRRVPPVQAQAEAAADRDFKFDWKTMPKFVRQAWGKE